MKQAVGEEGGGDYETTSTINTIAGVTSLTAGAVSNTLTLTNVGSDIAYSLSNSKIFLISAKYLKSVGYGATGVSVLTDVGLSINGQQSWTETGINTGVTVGAMIIGGWPGFIIQLDYIGAKAYMRTINGHPEWVLPPAYHSFIH
jgi:hypothetical protein